MSEGTPEMGGRPIDIEAVVRAGGIGHVVVPGALEEILRIVNGGEGPVRAHTGIFGHDTQAPIAAMGDGEFKLVQPKIIE